MSERPRPDFSREGTLRGSGRITANPRVRSLVESVLKAEGVAIEDVLTSKQLRKLRKAAQRVLPLGATRVSR